LIAEAEATFEGETLPGDAMSQRNLSKRQKQLDELARRAAALAEPEGFHVEHQGGGCEALCKRLKSIEGDGHAFLEVFIANDGGDDICADPDEPVWQVSVQLEDAKDVRSLDGQWCLTLSEAFEVARGYEARADELWEANFTGNVFGANDTRFAGM
jgi:hypothetical protein